MSTNDRRSGFGAGFSKDVEAVLGAADRALLYPDETRANLRIAGMVLREESPMPDFSEPYALETGDDEYTEQGDMTDE